MFTPNSRPKLLLPSLFSSQKEFKANESEIISDPVKLRLLGIQPPLEVSTDSVPVMSYQELVRRNFMKEYNGQHDGEFFELRGNEMEVHLPQADFLRLFNMTLVTVSLEDYR